MRDDEIRRVLAESNPWWRAVAAGTDPTVWALSNRLLRDRAHHDVGYRPDVLADLTVAPIGDSLVVLTGPRRIGKSVALLDLAVALCQRPDVDARQVIHVPCDGMAARDLRRVLTLARNMTRSVDSHQQQQRVWLLDEISGIQGWTSVLKAARDGTAFGDDTVVATGSRWVASEDIAGNLLAGRAGSTDHRRVRHLHPMPFRDFAAATRPGLALPSAVQPSRLQDDTVRQALGAVEFDVDEYDLAWQDYMTCGGFPRAVSEFKAAGSVSTAYLRDLAAWLRADVDREAPEDSLPMLLNALTDRATSPLNATSTAQTLGYPSTEPFTLRVTRLINSFAALRCPRRDANAMIVAGSQSKLYLADPLLSWLPSRLRAGLVSPDMTRLTEMTIGVALARAIDEIEEGRWIAGDTIGYARTASQNEIDLSPIPVPGATAETTVPIEAKWVDQGWRGESRGILAKYEAGVVATKSILDTTGAVWAVPAPLLALLLT